jgi:hypothetical protein
MLKVSFYRTPDTLILVDGYFDNAWKEDWMIDPLTKEMVRDIDKSEVVGPHLIESPFLGPIPPAYLSGGVKGLILAAFSDEVREFSSIIFGDNCTEWLLKLGEAKDFTIIMDHFLVFPGDFNGGSVYFVEYDRIATNYYDYGDATGDGRIARRKYDLEEYKKANGKYPMGYNTEEDPDEEW